jgi:hypothetical protein
VTYYSTVPPPQTTYDFEARKRGYDALDHFFGQVKRREVDPINFQHVSRRLFELQGLQLPQIIPATAPVPAYQPVSGISGGGYGHEDPIQSYSLPPMGNAKTREDLTSIDQILEQMQATIYESDNTQQFNGGYVNYGRSSHSPTTAHHMGGASAQAGTTSLLQHTHQDSIASDASTPGLTPPSSAQSYTSGQSPLPPHAAPTSSALYPTISAASDMAYTAANAATLSGMYEDEHRRRWDGSRLQRAAPAKDKDAMDIASDGSVTPPASGPSKAEGKKRASPNDSVIDPALAEGASTPRPESKDSPDQEQVWVQNMRLIEWMRDWIKRRIQNIDSDETSTSEGKEDVKRLQEEHRDTEMTGTDETSKEAEELYPVLKHVEESA